MSYFPSPSTCVEDQCFALSCCQGNYRKYTPSPSNLLCMCLCIVTIYCIGGAWLMVPFTLAVLYTLWPCVRSFCVLQIRNGVCQCVRVCVCVSNGISKKDSVCPPPVRFTSGCPLLHSLSLHLLHK